MDWSVTNLGSVAEVTVGFVGSMRKHFVDHGVPFLRSKNVRPHRIDVTDMQHINHKFHQKISKSRLRPGDVVTVRTGAPGSSCVIPDWLPEANCSDLVITRPGPRLDARWLSYYFNSAAKGYIDGQLVGAVQQHFNVGAAASMQFALPPVLEQQAIAEVLGALDDKIVANDQTAATLHELGAAKFKSATRKTPVVSLSTVVSPVLGGTPTRNRSEFWGGDVPWVSVRDISGSQHGTIIATEERISQLGSANSRARVIPKGSVVLSARGTVGEVARLGMPAAFNQSCYAFRPDILPPGVLYYSVKQAAQKAKQIAHGSVFSTITTKSMSSLEIPCLPSDEASELEQQLGPLLAAIDAALTESRALAQLRDTLLPALMDGKLRVRDAIEQVEGNL